MNALLIQRKPVAYPASLKLIIGAIVLNFSLICDPSDTNFGLGFWVSYLPIVLVGFGFMAYALQVDGSVFDVGFSSFL